MLCGKPLLHKRATLFVVAAGLVITFAVAALLVAFGVIPMNDPSRQDYPVRGVDVSEYQGKIDWQTLAGEDICFAYIKATEGASYTDPRFEDNFAQAATAGLRVGAYLFFSFESTGDRQAQNFIRQVPKTANALPPAVDVELYGKFKENPPDPAIVRAELQSLISALETAYGKKPVLYATARSYKLYLEENFPDCPVWIRNVWTSPSEVEWTFWQYTDKARLNGYSGAENKIDLNVFSGTAADFAKFAGG
ncbi:MAG: GH25 family lysozyme [Oscillospiraceae bacterium]